MTYLHTVPSIRTGLTYLLGNDPVFARAAPDIESFRWLYHGPGFATLCRIVTGQQLSVKAAAAVWRAFAARFEPVTPARLRAADPDGMRQTGLSRQKIACIQDLAAAIDNGTFDPASLDTADNKTVTAAITSLRGFGPWSATMYLMFGLARPDVWPAGDLGIQSGLQKYHNLSERPDTDKAEAYGELFSPHGTAASLLLWSL